MNDGVNKLNEIGAQKIHEQTHISGVHIKALIAQEFELMNSVQFLGFISILQREYKIDLSELKSKGLEYFSQIESSLSEEKKLFLVPQKKKNFIIVFIVLIIVIFIIVSLFPIFSSPTPETIKVIKTQKTVEVKDEIEEKQVIATEDNNTKLEADENNVSEIIEPLKSLKIFPRSKVWIGYIDLQTHKKYQTVFKDELTIDASKNWIIVFGHGNIDIEVDGEIRKFKNKNNLRFHYEDGELSKISYKEFKRLNKGRKW